MQDSSQLKKDYGKDQADVIMNITGNIISGQVMGETAKQLAERFGKIMQDRESVSINRTDTSISRSSQLEFAIPASKIASLSAGEFVGMVADDPGNKIKLKKFNCDMVNVEFRQPVKRERYKNIPIVSKVSEQQVMDNFFP